MENSYVLTNSFGWVVLGELVVHESNSRDFVMDPKDGKPVKFHFNLVSGQHIMKLCGDFGLISNHGGINSSM